MKLSLFFFFFFFTFLKLFFFLSIIIFWGVVNFFLVLFRVSFVLLHDWNTARTKRPSVIRDEFLAVYLDSLTSHSLLKFVEFFDNFFFFVSDGFVVVVVMKSFFQNLFIYFFLYYFTIF